MPADIVAEFAGGVFRLAVRVIFEVFYEWLVQGAGYLVIKLFRPGSQPSEARCLVVGLGVWSAVALVAFLVWRGSGAG